jgi:multidrug resistance efflux pump
MVRKFVLPLLAIAGVLFAVWTVMKGAQAVPAAKPVAEPAVAPYSRNVAGAGIVEALSENIAVGPVVPGVVNELYVKIGDTVKAGQPLFKVDDRDLRSQMVKAEAELAAAQARLTKVQAYPRPEEIPPAEAKVSADEQTLADMRNQYALMERVMKTDPRAVSLDDVDRRRFAVSVAEAKLAQSRAELALLKAGSWQQDVKVSQADVASAQATIDALKVEMERRITRAPINGRVLQLKIRLGEYAQTGVLAQPLVLLGNVDELAIRVDVDENDAWRIKAGAPAEATVRGNSALRTKLKFVRVEPYVIPKKSLTGESTERVDTRVLQVVYSFPADALPVYVGQQMDVFIESADSGAPTKEAGKP